jgi:hypothetical protein
MEDGQLNALVFLYSLVPTFSHLRPTSTVSLKRPPRAKAYISVWLASSYFLANSVHKCHAFNQGKCARIVPFRGIEVLNPVSPRLSVAAHSHNRQAGTKKARPVKGLVASVGVSFPWKFCQKKVVLCRRERRDYTSLRGN